MRCECYRMMTKMVETGRTLIRRDVLSGRVLVKCRKCQRQYVVDDASLPDGIVIDSGPKLPQ